MDQKEQKLMRTPLWLSKILLRARITSAGVALLVVCGLASGAMASPLLPFSQFPGGNASRGRLLAGMSLGDLLDGGEFESGNGKLLFSDFEAEIEGLAPNSLDSYRVLPTGSGFKLFSPLLAVSGSGAELTLDYKVATTDEELIVESASISFLGFALGDAEASVETSLFDGDGDPLGVLTAQHRLFDRGRARDRLDFDDPLRELAVAEIIGVHSDPQPCLGGVAAALMVDHRFKVAVIPEPATALLLGVGLFGLGMRRRRVGR